MSFFYLIKFHSSEKQVQMSYSEHSSSSSSVIPFSSLAMSRVPTPVPERRVDIDVDLLNLSSEHVSEFTEFARTVVKDIINNGNKEIDKLIEIKRKEFDKLKTKYAEEIEYMEQQIARVKAKYFDCNTQLITEI